MDTEPEPEFILLPEAAKRLSVSMKTVRNLILERKLTHRRIGNGWPKVLAADVARLLEESTIPSVGKAS